MRKDGERGIKNISLKQTFCNNKEQKVYTLIESLIYEYRGPKRLKGEYYKCALNAPLCNLNYLW